MARKKESLSAENKEIVDGQPEVPAEESKVEEQPETLTKRIYQIKCRNPINESFGGVSFHNGVASTKDGFTASWFRNKEGYTVSEVQEK